MIRSSHRSRVGLGAAVGEKRPLESARGYLGQLLGQPDEGSNGPLEVWARTLTRPTSMVPSRRALKRKRKRMVTHLSDGQNLTATSGRNTPSKTRKPRKIAIESDPFTAGLVGQRSKPCVRHQIASRVGLGAKVRKDLPVPFPRLNHQAVGLSKQDVAEPKHLIQGARVRKDLWVGGMRTTLLKTCGAIP